MMRRRLLVGLVGAVIVLAITSGINFYQFQTDMKVRHTRATINNYLTSLHLYKEDCVSFPSQDDGLNALTKDPGARGWKGPYIRGGLPLDMWNGQFQYTLIEGKPVVRSAGPDRKFHTKDDITN
jgi:general secretion pathway protein G